MKEDFESILNDDEPTEYEIVYQEVNDTLDIAKEFHMETEAITDAFLYLYWTKKLSIEDIKEALDIGLGDNDLL